jgi:hypothetical protein
LATSFSSIPASVLPLPFLLARSRSGDLEWAVRGALAAAIAAERAVDTGRRNTRARLAYLLCELGYQLARRGIDKDRPLTLPRVEIAAALATSLCRVKRTLALLTLSQVVETDCRTLRVLDWRRLSGIAGYDPRRLELSPDEDPELYLIRDTDEGQNHQLTASGDPACFV